MSFGISPDVPPQEGSVLPPVVDYPAIVPGLANLAASSSPQGVDSFSTLVFRATKYVLTVSQGSDFEAVEILLLSDGTNSFITAYGPMSSTGEPLAAFSAIVAAGIVTLDVALVSPVAATVNFQAIRVFA